MPRLICVFAGRTGHVVGFCRAATHMKKSEECVDPDQTPPSPVFTLFIDVLFHMTLKTLYYMYLRFVEAVFF